jgi:hypothetical protein
MNKAIFELLSDLKEICLDLKDNIRYFDESEIPIIANTYLITEYEYEDRLITEITKNISHDEIIFLDRSSKVLKQLLRLLASEMEIDLPEFKVTRVEPEAETIETFLHYLKVSQNFSAQIYNLMLQNFVLYLVPIKNIQEQLATIPNNLQPEVEEQWVDIDADDLTSQGDPDIEKFKSIEDSSFRFGKTLSISTSYSEMARYIDEEFPDILEEEDIQFIIESSFSDAYSQIYDFLYDQFLNINLPVATIKENFEKKFPDLNEFFIKSYKNKINQTYKDTPDKAKEIVKTEAETFIKYLEGLESEKFYSFEYPRVYRLDFRELTDFETEYYRGYFSVDIRSTENLSKSYDPDTLMITYMVADSPNTYNLVDEIIFNPKLDQDVY